MRRLLLVRHGSTAAVRAAAFGADEPLDESGVAGAARLRSRLPGRFSLLVSPARRALETAAGLGSPLVVPELAECDFGSWAGRSLSEIDPSDLGPWMTDPDAAPHGGESLTALLARVGAWLDEQASLDGTAVAVTHGGVVKAAVVHALSAPPSAFWRVDVSPLGITELHAHDGRWTVTRVNDRDARGAAGTASAAGANGAASASDGGRPARATRPARADAAGTSGAARRGRHERRGRHGRRGSGGVTAAGIVLGVSADALLGDPRRFHPVAGFGRAASALERVAYRPTRRAGAAYAAVLVGAVVAGAALAERVLPRTLVRAVALWAALGGRSLAREAQAVADLVERDEIEAARTRIRSLVGRDPQHLDGTGLCKAAIESVAENTVDAVIAPLFWVAVAGAPGVLGHRAVNTLDAMVGKRDERYARFGTASARADDVANWPAARLAGALVVALGGGGAANAWRDGAAKHPSPNAGVIEAAFAGALGLKLGGTLAYAGRVEQRPELGDGREPGPADVARAISLARRISFATAVLAAAWSRGR